MVAKKEEAAPKPAAKAAPKPAPKVAAKDAKDAKDAAAEAKPKGEKKGSTTKKAAPVVITQPEVNGHKVFKLAFVFPKPRENPQKMFARIKGPVYYALGGSKTVVEMAEQVDEVEQVVWEAAYKTATTRRAPPPLVAVRVSPFVWEDPVQSAAKYDKVKDLFKDIERIAEVNLDTKTAFSLPDFGPKGDGKGDAKTGEKPKPRPKKTKTEPVDLATIECYDCHEKGHWARDCTNKKEKKEGDKSNIADMECYQCNEKGHLARDCKAPKKEKKEPRKKKESDAEKTPMKCYVCQQMGHIAKDCPSATDESRKEAACWHCKETGHRSKDCPVRKDDAKEAPTMTCYNCQGKGHLAKDCTNAKQERKKNDAPDTKDVLCYNCNTTGHYAKNCQEKPRERKPKRDAPAARNTVPEGPPKCEREAKDRDTGKVVLQGCGGDHAYNECPRHKCNNCNDNHLSSRCPYMK